MGSGYIKKCSQCGHKTTIFEGIGMMDYYGYYNTAPSNKDSNWKSVIKSERILKSFVAYYVQGCFYELLHNRYA